MVCSVAERSRSPPLKLGPGGQHVFTCEPSYLETLMCWIAGNDGRFYGEMFGQNADLKAKMQKTGEWHDCDELGFDWLSLLELRIARIRKRNLGGISVGRSAFDYWARQ